MRKNHEVIGPRPGRLTARYLNADQVQVLLDAANYVLGHLADDLADADSALEAKEIEEEIDGLSSAMKVLRLWHPPHYTVSWR